MPPISPAIYLNTLVTRNATDPNSTINALQVVCAWPVSGQYGPGSRVLYVLSSKHFKRPCLTICSFASSRYYALVAACVIARKADWLRNACLAGALLFPAVAALHGVVLAAMHVNGKASVLDIRFICKLMFICLRCCRYGRLWGISIMLNRHLDRSCCG